MSQAPIQAFVLKCPECGAPQPGTTAECTHCKVPLMWAPTRRFGSDDHGLYDVEDEPGTALLSFGPKEIKPGDTLVFHLQSAKLVKPRFLWIHPRCSDWVRVKDVRLGVDIIGEVGYSEHGMPGSLFSRGRGFPLDTEVMIPGIIFNFQVLNCTVQQVVFEGVLRVMPFNDQDLPRSGFGPQMMNQQGRLRENVPGAWGPVIVNNVGKAKLR